MLRLAALLLFPPTLALAAPRIAILDEPGFPFYMAAEVDSPRLFQDLFRGIGLEAELVSVQALADPASFSAEKYAAYVHPYGNTFPLEALANLRAFHRAGGCLIIPSGVPFCHPCVVRGAAMWAFSAKDDRNGRTLDSAHSGNAALRIHNAGADGWTGPASARFAVQPGEKFTVGGWVKVERDNPAHEKSVLYMRFFDATGQFVGQDGPPLPSRVCDWTRVERQVSAAAGAVVADVCPQVWGRDAEVLLDDLALVRAGSEGNLLGNPSFEQPGGGWTDLGHDEKYLGHAEGLATGSFVTREYPGDFSLSESGKGAGLDAVDWSLVPGPQLAQTLAAESLPPEDEVRPLVFAGDPAQGIAPATMIVHGCDTCKGAVDVWCRSHCMTITGRVLYQVVLKSTVAALQENGVLSDAEVKAMIAKADETVSARKRAFEPVTEPRPFDTPWPHSARPAETIQVCDVSTASPEQEFALTVLQGIVNRTQPRLYLIHTRYARQDREWLAELHLEGLKSEEISAEAAWARFGGEVKGAVVYDRAILKEIGAFHADKLNVTNLVLMLCATRDAVPLALDAGAEAPTGTTVLFDTRGKWATPGEMYQWAYETLWPEMNHHILGTLYPGIFYLTDYLVQHRVFTFWFPSQRTLQEQELLETILASTPPNTPILGWWFDWMPNVQDPGRPAADCVGEGEGVQTGSTFGKFLTPSHEAANLSVHSGMPLLGIKHKPVANPQTLDKGKVYYSFLMSDGDNLGECLMLRTRGERWDVPERGKVPMGWSFAPATAVLAPPVLNYYLRTASEADLLVGGLGIAYTQPDAYANAFPKQREAIFVDYARMTADALAPLDTGCLWLIGGSKTNVSRYASAGAPLRAIFPDYGTGVKRAYDSVTYMDQKDVAVFRAVTGWGGDEPYADRLVREIRAASDGARPAFLHVFLLNWGTNLPLLQDVMSRLGDEYVCVRPDELDRLFREAGK